MLFRKFKVCMCPHCNEVSTTEAGKVLRCLYCRKTTQFQYKNKPGLQVRVLFHTDDAREAVATCQKLKLMKAQGKLNLI